MKYIVIVCFISLFLFSCYDRKLNFHLHGDELFPKIKSKEDFDYYKFNYLKYDTISIYVATLYDIKNKTKCEADGFYLSDNAIFKKDFYKTVNNFNVYNSPSHNSRNLYPRSDKRVKPIYSKIISEKDSSFFFQIGKNKILELRRVKGYANYYVNHNTKNKIYFFERNNIKDYSKLKIDSIVSIDLDTMFTNVPVNLQQIPYKRLNIKSITCDKYQRKNQCKGWIIEK
ncbi:MAG: hypothetical protein KA275_02035 [Chitinophagaceae bacterium]|nr:hypothetical protein [Chitinophagaceae bacterium]